jgi:hypothetical protein
MMHYFVKIHFKKYILYVIQLVYHFLIINPFDKMKMVGLYFVFLEEFKRGRTDCASAWRCATLSVDPYVVAISSHTPMTATGNVRMYTLIYVQGNEK